MLLAKYSGRYFFSVKEISILTKLAWHSVKKFIEKKQVFAVKIGKDWRIFWDEELENSSAKSSSFHLPDFLNCTKMSDILYVSEPCIKRYILRIGLYSISKQKFSQFLMKNSNLEIFGSASDNDYEPMSAMVSNLLIHEPICHNVYS